MKQLTTRVDHLYTWKASTNTTLKSVQAKETAFDKLLDGLPTWKRQVDAGLHNGQARFEDFLSKHWQPVKKKFDQMLEEWHASGREKRTRVVAETLTMMTRETFTILPTMTRHYQYQNVIVLQPQAGIQNSQKDNSHG